MKCLTFVNHFILIAICDTIDNKTFSREIRNNDWATWNKLAVRGAILLSAGFCNIIISVLSRLHFAQLQTLQDRMIKILQLCFRLGKQWCWCRGFCSACLMDKMYYTSFYFLQDNAVVFCCGVLWGFFSDRREVMKGKWCWFRYRLHNKIWGFF